MAPSRGSAATRLEGSLNELHVAVAEFATTLREQRHRFVQRRAFGQQKLRGLFLGGPDRLSRGDARAGAQHREVLLHPLLDARPVPQQRFVRNHDDAASVGAAIDDEKPRLHERIDERPTRRRRGDHVDARALAHNAGGAFIEADADERAEYWRHRGPHLGGERQENLLGPACQRALDAAEFPVGFEGEPAALWRAAIVELRQRELEQRQRLGTAQRGLAECVSERKARFRFLVEGHAGHPRRLADDLGYFRRGRSREIVGARAFAQFVQRRDLDEARIKIAAQGGGNPDLPGTREAVHGGGKDRALFGGNAVVGKDLLELVDQQREPRLRNRRQLFGPLQIQRGQREGHLHERAAGEGRLAQNLRQLGAPGAAHAEFGQRRADGAREPVAQIPSAFAGLQRGFAPERHALDHARFDEEREDAGAQQRGLSAAAHAGDQDERTAVGGLAAERVKYVADRARASAKDRRVLRLEHLEPAKRRAFLPGRRRRSRGRGGRRLFFEHLAQVRLEALLEFRQRVEIVPRRDERALVLVREPAAQKIIEHFFLPHALEQRLFVAQADDGLRGFQIHEHVRPAKPAVRLDGVLELELRTRRVGRPVRAVEFFRGQARAEPRPEDAHADVGVAGGRDLLLKRASHQEWLVFPINRLEREAAGELLLQALDHAHRLGAFLVHVTGRGNENAHQSHGGRRHTRPYLRRGTPRKRGGAHVPLIGNGIRAAAGRRVWRGWVLKGRKSTAAETEKKAVPSVAQRRWRLAVLTGCVNFQRWDTGKIFDYPLTETTGKCRQTTKRHTTHSATMCQTLSTTMMLHGADGGFANSGWRFILVIQKRTICVRSCAKCVTQSTPMAGRVHQLANAQTESVQSVQWMAQGSVRFFLLSAIQSFCSR